MSKTTTLAKPTLGGKTTSAAALAFAEAGTAPEKAVAKQASAERRRLAAIEQDCTATEIIERLLVKELGQ